MRRTLGISVFAAVVALASAVTFSGNAVAQPGNPSPTAVYHDVYRTVNDRYTGSRPQGWQAFNHKFDNGIANGADLERAVKEALASIGDERLKLLTPAEVEQLKSRLESGYVGVGLSLDTMQVVGNDVLLKEVFTDSTAEEAGLQSGDRLLAVGGRRVSGLTLSEVTSLIGGEAGTQVALTVERRGAVHNIAVARDLDERIGVSVELDKPTTLYLLSWVREDSPASAAGLAKGDVIVEIDGVGVASLPVEEVSKRLRQGTIGSTVKVAYLRDKERAETTITRGIVKSWDLSFGLSSQRGGAGPADNRSHMELKNLDWTDIVKNVEIFDDAFESPAFILDLRGASGDNAELAARVGARFLSRDARIIVVAERIDGVEQVTTYELRDGELLRTDSRGTTVVERVEKRYQGKLVVVTDGKTSGTAAAIAHALKRAGSTVVGMGTDDRSELTSHVFFGDLVVAVPSGKLQSLDGVDFDGVSPDRRVFFSDSLTRTAIDELAGTYWYNSPESIVYGVAAVLIALFVGFHLLLARRTARKSDADNALPNGAGDAAPAANTAGDTTTAAADEPQQQPADSKPGGAKRERLFALIMLAAVVAVFASLPLLGWVISGAPSGTTTKLVIEAYVDGGTRSELQVKTIEELKSQYTGDIEFKITDVRQNPDVTQSYKGSDFGAVKHTPSVRISQLYFDKDGEEIQGGWSMGGAATRRELVERINWYSKEGGRKYWPSLRIERNKK